MIDTYCTGKESKTPIYELFTTVFRHDTMKQLIKDRKKETTQHEAKNTSSSDCYESHRGCDY